MRQKVAELDDKNIIKIKGSRKLYIPIYVMIIILILVMVILKIQEYPLNKFVIIAAIIFIILCIKGTEIHRLTRYYQITNHYLVYSKGIFKNNIKKIFIPTISDLVLKQNIWQRILNYGDVLIHRYTTGSVIDVKNINDPEYFVENLEEIMNTLREREMGKRGGKQDER